MDKCRKVRESIRQTTVNSFLRFFGTLFFSNFVVYSVSGDTVYLLDEIAFSRVGAAV